MIKIPHSKWMWPAAIAMSMGVAGCNLFHPTESRDAESDDAPALTLDGYKEFQEANYDEARKLFSRALRADSSYSEAWVGLAKAVLNTQEGLNAFELVSYAQTTKQENGKSTSKLLTMPDDEARTILKGIDSVMVILNQFFDRDTTGRTDKKIRFSNIADSYTILQLTKAGLRIRGANTQLTSIVSAGNSGMMMDLNVLNDLGDSLKPFLNDMAQAAEAIKSSPESSSEIIKAILPDSTRQYFDDNDYADITVGLANSVIQMNDRAQTVPEDRNDVFFKFGNGRDDDGDGCVDEEVLDNYDNDGDGEIDEDVRDNRAVVLVKKKPTNMLEATAIAQDVTTYDLTKAQVDSLSVLGKYDIIDIDMDGKTTQNDLDEWRFVYRNPNERDEKDNHLLQFAETISYNYRVDFKYPGNNLDKLIENKEKIRHDTDVNNIKYNLQKRKEMVGGCWVNYDEDEFIKWFEGRNE